jgi:hypothetical protein
MDGADVEVLDFGPGGRAAWRVSLAPQLEFIG